MARIPKPTAIKLSDGTRKSEINMNEPKAIPFEFSPPSHLDEIGKDAFNRLARTLKEMGVLSDSDRSLLGLYADTYSEYMRCLEFVQRTGIMIKAANGSDKRNPVQSETRACRATLMKIYVQCGLTPASRSTLTVEPSPSDDDQMRSNDVSWETGGWNPEDLLPPKCN